MSLSGALGIAQSSLANSAAQSALLSRNIANVSNTDYSRRSASTVSQTYGSVTQGETQRATAKALLDSLLSAASKSAASSALGDGLDSLASTLGLSSSSAGGSDSAVATDTSPATLLGAFATAMQRYDAQPDSQPLAAAAVQAAKDLAANLNAASSNVQDVRAQADGDMATSVKTINGLLAKFKTANDAVIAGSAAGSDVTDAQDARDAILKQLSGEIGISTTQNENGGLSIYTDGGVTLFETNARAVTFSPTSSFVTGTVGQSVTIDGIPVTGSSAITPITTGKLAGLATLRDVASVAYGDQLDQVASALVNSFAESATGKPSLAGLFTSGGSSALPTSTRGVAASIAVNARVDAPSGGLPTRLRDGNVSSDDPAYTANTDGSASYSGRLDALVAALGANRSFDAKSGGSATGSIETFAASSVSWISAQRQVVASQTSSTSALASSAATALSNATGVNLDDEMSRMLDIEHAYQASAQLLNTVNAMYGSLLQAFN